MRPVGFLVVGQNTVRMLPVDGNPVAERLIDLAPNLLERLQVMMQQKQQQETPPESPVI